MRYIRRENGRKEDTLNRVASISQKNLVELIKNGKVEHGNGEGDGTVGYVRNDLGGTDAITTSIKPLPSPLCHPSSPHRINPSIIETQSQMLSPIPHK